MIYLNGNSVNVTRFPDNTTQVWKLPEGAFISDYQVIEWHYSYEGELIEIAQLKDLLEHHGKTNVMLMIEYLPFARQDKEISNTSTFALRSFAKLLNSLNFDEIFITDPHSTVALELINNSFAHYPYSRIQKAVEQTGSAVLCYPDKGAVEKYVKVYSKFLGLPYIYGEKVRDQLTGNITRYNLVDDTTTMAYKNGKVLIIDDICDGGKTFEILAQVLYAAGFEEVNLFVTHGIFTKGLRPLYEAGINRIFTGKGEVAMRTRLGGIVYEAQDCEWCGANHDCSTCDPDFYKE